MAKVKIFVHTPKADARAMILAPRTYLSRLAYKGLCDKIVDWENSKTGIISLRSVYRLKKYETVYSRLYIDAGVIKG